MAEEDALHVLKHVRQLAALLSQDIGTDLSPATYRAGYTDIVNYIDEHCGPLNPPGNGDSNG